MLPDKKKETLSDKLRLAFDKAREQVIAEEKANGYLVVSDKNGKVIKIPAKDL